MGALLTASLAAGAEVLRCTDTAGHVSYTDGHCPAGTRAVGRVAVPSPDQLPSAQEADRRRQEQIDSANRAARLQRESVDTVTRQSASPGSGPVILDPPRRDNDTRWSQRSGDDVVIIDDGRYPPYPGAYGGPRPLPDMRPRLRRCDGAGCSDTQGNHYDRSGRLDRYRSIDGRTCRPVGTTTVCQ